MLGRAAANECEQLTPLPPRPSLECVRSVDRPVIPKNPCTGGKLLHLCEQIACGSRREVVIDREAELTFDADPPFPYPHGMHRFHRLIRIQFPETGLTSPHHLPGSF